MTKIDSLQAVLNKFLVLDEKTVLTLSQMAGKIIGIELVNTDMRFYLLPSGSGIQITMEVRDSVDVWIRATPVMFLAMLVRKDMGGRISDLQINGNVELAQIFQRMVASFSIDLGQILSPYVGEIIAHRLERLVQYSGRRLKSMSNSLLLDTSEYLRFEIKILVEQVLLDDFLQGVEELRFAVDRLQQRLNKLEQHLKPC